MIRSSVTRRNFVVGRRLVDQPERHIQNVLLDVVSGIELRRPDDRELVLRGSAFGGVGFNGFISGIFAVTQAFVTQPFVSHALIGAVVHSRILRVAVDPSLTNYS